MSNSGSGRANGSVVSRSGAGGLCKFKIRKASEKAGGELVDGAL